MKLCSVEECGRGTTAKGYCQTHYRRVKSGQPLNAPINPALQRTRDPAERFWEKVDQSGDCWLWTGGRLKTGYGVFSVNGDTLLAHRYIYQASNGPIPAGLVIDHLCMNPSCVRLAHLELVTVAENTRRGYSGPIGAAFQKGKTHCPKGHAYDAANTRLWTLPSGRTGRKCRTCERDRSKKQAA